MTLHPEAQQLIQQVEKLSGRMVHVTEEPQLQVMATVSIARGVAPAHFLSYILASSYVKGPDYPSETFRVHKEKQTRRLVLEAWDRMEAEGTFASMELLNYRN